MFILFLCRRIADRCKVAIHRHNWRGCRISWSYRGPITMTIYVGISHVCDWQQERTNIVTLNGERIALFLQGQLASDLFNLDSLSNFRRNTWLYKRQEHEHHEYFIYFNSPDFHIQVYYHTLGPALHWMPPNRFSWISTRLVESQHVILTTYKNDARQSSSNHSSSVVLRRGIKNSTSFSSDIKLRGWSILRPILFTYISWTFPLFYMMLPCHSRLLS